MDYAYAPDYNSPPSSSHQHQHLYQHEYHEYQHHQKHDADNIAAAATTPTGGHNPVNPYEHLLQVPLSSVWEFSDETYRGWSEELLAYEKDWIVSQMRRGPPSPPSSSSSSSSSSSKSASSLKEANRKTERGGKDSVICDDQTTTMGESTPRTPRQGCHHHERVVEKVRNEVGKLDIHKMMHREDDIAVKHEEEEDYHYGCGDVGGSEGEEDGCLGCNEFHSSSAGLWGLACGHAFHPDCLRQYLQTCWQTCQHRDRNAIFMCPHCGDQLDPMWCRSLLGITNRMP